MRMSGRLDFSPGVLPGDTSQMIMVLTDSWEDCRARLTLYERKTGKWEEYRSFSAVCGKNGMAWGSGLNPVCPGETLTPFKREGDQKTPAGIFRLGECMGYAPMLTVNPKLPYRQINESLT